MRKALLTVLLTGSISYLSAYQLEEIKENHNHGLLSSFFFRHHDEGAYEYDVTGIGMHYNYLKEDHLNVRAGALMAFKDKNFFSENEVQLWVHRPINDVLYTFPTFSKKLIFHHFSNIDDVAVWATKATAYLGAGFGGEFDRFSFHIQAEGFKDLLNKITLKSEDKSFSGRFFTSPYGYRVKTALKARTWLENWIGIEGFWSNAFDRSYKECGAQIQLEWGL